MNITLKQLQVFSAVARHENLGRAAEELFLTKGAISQSLQELEKHLGTLLFDRVHPYIRLNHEGARLRAQADELLQRAGEIERLFTTGQSPCLNVGASKTIGDHILPALLHAFEKRCGWLPQAHIANSDRLLELAADFTLDVVLLEGEEHHPDLIIKDWLADEMVVMAHKGHALTKGTRHSLRELDGERWILREPHSGTRAYFDHILGPLIAPYRVALSLSSPEAVLGMVEQGMGLTFASRLTAQLPGSHIRLGVVNLNRSFARMFSIAYHSGKHHTAGMDQFVKFCLEWIPPENPA